MLRTQSRCTCTFWAICAVLLVGPSPIIEASAQEISPAEFERLKAVCVRGPPDAFPPARLPNDLNSTFGPIKSGEAFAELSPRVLSSDPWVVLFENFLTEKEMLEIDDTLFHKQESTFAGSVADRSGSNSRKSETAFCVDSCARSKASRLIEQRASEIVRAPVENIDFIQALRYKPGMFYREHHDNRNTFKYLPCGSRTFTFFVYLSDVEEGGGTRFPKLNVTVAAKRGHAVLFQDTKDAAPDESDDRTAHEALPVIKGLKRGLNVWVYNYNYREYWAKGCTSIMLADMLGGHVKPSKPSVAFSNHMSKKVSMRWVDPSNRAEVELDTLNLGETKSFDTQKGHQFIFRAVEGNGIVGEYTATAKASQTFNLMEAKARSHGDEL